MATWKQNEFPSLGGQRAQTPIQNNTININMNMNNSSMNNQLPPGLTPTMSSAEPLATNLHNLTINNNNNNNSSSSSGTKPETEWTDMDRYGLNGLLSLVRGEHSDQNTVALGTDVNFLGLDLSRATDGVKLSKTFASPWVETSRSEVEPEYQTPAEFNIGDAGKLEDKIVLFTDETLFYIFYTRPNDVLQELSARELMNRNWRYHKELNVWLTKDSSVEPQPQGPQSERGVYLFFDPHNWEKVKKEFMLYYQAIMA